MAMMRSTPGDPLRPALLRRGVLADLQRGRLALPAGGAGGALCGAVRGQDDRDLPHARQLPHGRLGRGADGLHAARLFGCGRFDDETHLIAGNRKRANEVPTHDVGPVGQRQRPSAPRTSSRVTVIVLLLPDSAAYLVFRRATGKGSFAGRPGNRRVA